MNMIRKYLAQSTLLIVSFFGVSQFANAGLILFLDDPTTAGIDVIVADNGAIGSPTDNKGLTTHADGHGGVGVVMFNGIVGNWIINVTTGTSKPVLDDQLDLFSVNVSGSAGTLDLGLTDTDFSSFNGLGGNAIASIEIGGVVGGTINYSAYADIGDAEFGDTDQLIGLGTHGPGDFSNEIVQSIGIDGAYSLSAFATIEHTSVGQDSSFDFAVKVSEPTTVSEPASLSLLGIGLIGLMIRRRKARSSR